MSNEAVVTQDFEQIVGDPKPKPTVGIRPRVADRYRDLVSSSDPRKVTDQSVKLLFRDWELAAATEAKAKQMVLDAQAWKQRAAEAIAAHIGSSECRYKGVLYSPAISRGKITLKAMKEKKVP